MLNTKRKAVISAALLGMLAMTALIVIFALPVRAGASDPIAPDALWETEGSVQLTNAVASPSFASGGSGMLATFGQSDASIRYVNPVDVSSNARSDVVFSYLPVPSAIGTLDYQELHMTLTDATDPDNYITVKMQYYHWDGGMSTYFSLYYTGSASLWRATEWGSKPINPAFDKITTSSESGLTVYKSMIGTPHTVNPTGKEAPFNLHYDAADRSMWMENEAGNLQCILDLDDPTYTGAGNEWSGFKSNYVYLTVSVKKLIGSAGQILVYGVNGNPLDGAVVVDRKAPSLVTDADRFGDVLPAAEVGRDYTVFAATASDEIDGDLTGQIEVTLTTPENRTAPCGQTVTVSQPGRHTLTYAVSDAAGQSFTRSYTFMAYMSLDDLSLALDSAPVSAAKVGERVTVPSAVASGGTRTGLNVRTQVFNAATGRTYTVANGQFTPDSAGRYVIRYVADDYIGNARTFDYTIEVTRGTLPIAYFIEDDAFLPALIGGKTVELPDVEAYDYVSNPAAVQDAKLRIAYRYAGESAFTPIQGRVFTPDADKTSVSLRYTAYYGDAVASDGSNAVSKTYADIPIVAPQQLGDYFIRSNADVRYDRSYIEFTAADTTQDAQLECINVLSANNFSVTMNVAQSLNDEKQEDAGRNNFDSLRVQLSDADDPRISLTFDIRKNVAGTNLCDLYFNGTRYEINGSFFFDKNLQETPLVLRLNNETGEVTDYNFNRILIARNSDNGSAFTGFPSGGVRLKISMTGVKGASGFRLINIVNQAFFGITNAAGDLSPFVDTVKPIIELAYPLEMDGTYGGTAVIPAARAFDVLDPYVVPMVAVIAPDGTVVYDGTATEDLSVQLTQYGTYTVEYSATDASGRGQTTRKVIDVLDRQDPQLVVSGSLPASVRQGETVTLPTVIVSDNLTPSENIRVYMFLIDPRLTMLDVRGQQSVTLDRAGTYTLMYYLLDETGNYTMRTYQIVSVGD